MIDKASSLGRSVVLPSSLAAIGLGILGLFLGKILGDTATLVVGLGSAWLAFVVGRVLAHLDLPRGRGVFLRHILTGLAIGLVAMALLKGLFREGPGWPWTPWWALLCGFGFGLFRSHKALLKDAREKHLDAPRLLGIFHPKDLEALGVLLAGYALVGLTGFLIFRAFSGSIPSAGKALTIGIALYALQGARYLLVFAREERGRSGASRVAWIKANALQLAIVALVLTAYAIFRDQLASAIPFYPLVEFGLGMAVFGFVLARLRSALRRDGSALATASVAKDHERVVTELREGDYDALAHPLTRFIESGRGQKEYAEALASSLPPANPRAQAIRSALAQHREPPRPPALEMEWAFAAGAALAIGLAIAAFMLGSRLLNADMPFPLLLAVLLVAFGVYAQQDVARAHLRPWLAVGIAAVGAGILFLDLVFFLANVTALGAVPPLVWSIALGIFAVMVGIPFLSSWSLVKKIRAGTLVDARHIAPALELSRELQRARRRAATMMLVAVSVLLPVPWIAGWLGERGIIPSEFPAFLDGILSLVISIATGIGAAALIRFYGLTRARPKLIAREKAKRARRLALHKEIMRTLERA